MARLVVGAVAVLIGAGLLGVVVASLDDTPAVAAGSVTGEACQQGEGVTVVVDFSDLPGGVVVGCAAGTQPSGFAALAAAGFAAGFEGGPGFVCTIDGRPTEGFPHCWTTGGYWSYWKKDRGGAWDFSGSGGAAGPLAIDSVEGWRWADGFTSAPPAGDETSAPPVTTTTTTTTEPAPTTTVPAPTTSVAKPSTTVPGTSTIPGGTTPTVVPGGPSPTPVGRPVSPGEAAAAGAPRVALARTGTDPRPAALAGGVLVAVGLALVGRTRRRASHRV